VLEVIEMLAVLPAPRAFRRHQRAQPVRILTAHHDLSFHHFLRSSDSADALHSLCTRRTLLDLLEFFVTTLRYGRNMRPPIPRLNYQHLLYFWSVVRNGSLTKACAELHLSAPTVSAQLRTFEERLGSRLLMKSGRTLVPTEAGRLIFSYAEEIFALGADLLNALAQRPTHKPMRVVAGSSVPHARSAASSTPFRWSATSSIPRCSRSATRRREFSSYGREAARSAGVGAGIAR
jgi:hypothetical protein